MAWSQQQIDDAARAIFDLDEDINLEFIARMDAEGRREVGDGMGRERDSWDNPKNHHCHDAYRRRAIAALDVAASFIEHSAKPEGYPALTDRMLHAAGNASGLNREQIERVHAEFVKYAPEHSAKEVGAVSDEAWGHVRFVHDTFKCDLEQGYKTKDKEFAVDLLGRALEASRIPVVAGADWRDDPSADERWQAGCDFALEQLCAAMQIDPKSFAWDAATETLDGDVQAVIWRIIRLRLGEDWSPAAPIESAPAAGVKALPALHTILEQADMLDGRVAQTVRAPDGSEYQRIVHSEEAYGASE